MIRPLNGTPKVSPAALTVLLNTDVVDQLFRCINGSVAVSAYELQALPLPPPEDMQEIVEPDRVSREPSDASERGRTSVHHSDSTETFAALFNPGMTSDTLRAAMEEWQRANLAPGALARIAIMRRGAVAGAKRVRVIFPMEKPGVWSPVRAP